MDVRSFADELLSALAVTGRFNRVALQTEGPVADGYAYTDGNVILRFYFNQITGTIGHLSNFGLQFQRNLCGRTMVSPNKLSTTFASF